MPTQTLLDAAGLGIRRGDRDLFRGVSLVLRRGDRVGLVGANGSGKSTLLALLAGSLAPDEGSVRRAPGVQVALVDGASTTLAPGATLLDLAEEALGPLRGLEAELEAAAAAVARGAAPEPYLELLSLFEERGGFTARERLRSGLEAFGLAESVRAREASACSGGERQRAALAGALASGAEVLLLDEPSNQLDIRARAALASLLRGHDGALLLASHDRALLDAAATHVARLADGRLEVRRGGYAAVERDHAARGRARLRDARERQKEARRLERMAEELAQHGHRGAQTRRRRAERAREALLAAEREPTPRPGTPLPTATGRARGELLTATHLSAADVLGGASLRLERGDRVALVGPSGSGKSTLLALLAGERASDDPRALLRYADGLRLLHLDQVWRGLEPGRTPRAILLEWVGEARAASVLRLVGLERGAWDREARTLSGGELARAGLGLLVVREADLLLLDEPTNGLDLPSIETLEATLVSSDAAVVVASHDERLLEAIGAEAVAVEGGELVRYRGGVAGYRRGARRRERGLERSAQPGGGAGGVAADAQGATDRHPVTASADAAAGVAVEADLAADLAALEAAIERAEAALSDPTRLREREVTRWRERRSELEGRLLERWDAAAPPPQPRFRTRESGQRVWAEHDGDGLRVWLEGGPGTRVLRLGTVAHLVPEPERGATLLPWARRALYDGAARLAIYVLGVEAVQVACGDDLSGGPFRPLHAGWWVVRRADLEEREGWMRRDAVGRGRGRRPG